MAVHTLATLSLAGVLVAYTFPVTTAAQSYTVTVTVTARNDCPAQKQVQCVVTSLG